MILWSSPHEHFIQEMFYCFSKFSIRIPTTCIPWRIPMMLNKSGFIFLWKLFWPTIMVQCSIQCGARNCIRDGLKKIIYIRHNFQGNGTKRFLFGLKCDIIPNRNKCFYHMCQVCGSLKFWEKKRKINIFGRP